MEMAQWRGEDHTVVDLGGLVLGEVMNMEVLLWMAQDPTEEDLEGQVLIEVGLWIVQVQIDRVMKMIKMVKAGVAQ